MDSAQKKKPESVRLGRKITKERRNALLRERRVL